MSETHNARWLVPALGLTLALGLAHCGPRSGGSTSAGDSTATPAAGSGAALVLLILVTVISALLRLTTRRIPVR